MHRWMVGDVEIVRVESTAFALPTPHEVPAWMIPDFAPTAGEIGMAFSAVLIRAGDRRIVVDPWLADDGPREREDAAAVIDDLLGQMSELDFAAADVDLVVNSHVEGVGWNTRPDGASGWTPTFPNARYRYPAAEIDAVVAGEEPHQGTELDDLLAAEVLDPIPAEACVPLVPGVDLVDAPGHNAGHVAMRVESGGDVAVIPAT